MNGYPRIYIGARTIKEFRSRIPHPTYFVNQDTIAPIIERFSGIRHRSIPLILEDIGYLSHQSQSHLLRFVEDSPLNIILLSTVDNIIPTIISRMSLVYKISDPVKSNFLSPQKGMNRISEYLSEDSHYYDKCRLQSQESPILYYYNKVIPNKRNKLLKVIMAENND